MFIGREVAPLGAVYRKMWNRFGKWIHVRFFFTNGSRKLFSWEEIIQINYAKILNPNIVSSFESYALPLSLALPLSTMWILLNVHCRINFTNYCRLNTKKTAWEKFSIITLVYSLHVYSINDKLDLHVALVHSLWILWNTRTKRTFYCIVL